MNVLIGKARVSVCANGRDEANRTRYTYAITLPTGTYYNDDLRSGGDGTEREGMNSLLTFLTACAESYPDGDDADMFPRNVAEWAAENAEEIYSQSVEFQN